MLYSIGLSSGVAGRLLSKSKDRQIGSQLAVWRSQIGVNFCSMTGGQAIAVGVSLTLLVVIAVAVAVLAWRRKVLERHRTPADRYRHAADDLQQLHDQIERDSDRRRVRRQRGSSGGSGI